MQQLCMLSVFIPCLQEFHLPGNSSTNQRMIILVLYIQGERLLPNHGFGNSAAASESQLVSWTGGNMTFRVSMPADA